MSNIQVIGLGALNMDNIYKVERILEDGEAVVRDFAAFPGGSAANTVYSLARLGVSTSFIGVVGDDAEGKALIQDLQKAGVDTGQIREKDGVKTGATLCLSDESGRRSIYVLPGANNLLTTDDLDFGYINRTRWLHVSSFVEDAQFGMLLELIKILDSSVRLSFAPGMLYAQKGLKPLTPILARTYVLFINEDEIHQLTGEDFTTGAKTCLNQGCHIVVVTLGQGISYKAVMATSYIRTADGEYAVKPKDKSIISAFDTIGAGDAFAAGFLYGLLNQKGLEECAHLGDIVARFSIASTGGRQGLPTPNELARRYRQLYHKPL